MLSRIYTKRRKTLSMKKSIQMVNHIDSCKGTVYIVLMYVQCILCNLLFRPTNA